MSQNETDQITQETGRTFRQILTAAREWMWARQLSNRQGQRMTRKERKQLAEHIQAQVEGDRIATAWLQSRVGDYQQEALTVAAMRGNPHLYHPDMVTARQDRLQAMRHRIETTLHNSGLAIEHRGQVSQALDGIDRDPVTPPGRVFREMDATEAMYARAAGVESELRHHARQEELDRLVTGVRQQDQQHLDQHAAQRAQGPTAAQDTTASPQAPASRPPNPPWLTDQQLAAVQNIRAVQVDWNDAQDANRAGYEAIWAMHASEDWKLETAGKAARDMARLRQSAIRSAVLRAQAAGLSEEQIRWEFDNADGNSRCRVSVTSADRNGETRTRRGFFATEAEAAQWAHQAVTGTEWQPGTTLTVRAREAGTTTPFYVAEGNQADIGKDTSRWRIDTSTPRTTTAEHATEQPNPQDPVAKAKSTQRGARATNGTGATQTGQTRPRTGKSRNAFAAAAEAEQDNDRDGAER
ncbi:hypothetical protein JK358_34315 [Nocardia sp. 2]|uniref:Uncharacterized protein n=1 Tax=Nocardia acididurans TaxID=2802282 RepID=A0ABS1MJS2_9NOCA|nr:hypothetical protein [Nocardia acididurans]MBL1079493.1 hypothetical protein [Nocardia acididurans]